MSIDTSGTYSIREIVFPEEDIKPGDFVTRLFSSFGYLSVGIVDFVSTNGVIYHHIDLNPTNKRNPRAEDVHITAKVLSPDSINDVAFVNPLNKSIVAGSHIYNNMSRQGLLGQIPKDVVLGLKRF